jgi:spore coat protein U-like protein
VLSGNGLAFGAYDLLAAGPTDTQATIVVQCERTGGTPAVSLSLHLDAGANAVSVEARRMLHAGGSGSTLAYGMYRDPARTSPWGVADGIDTVGATLSVPDRGTASAQFTIYGRMPARQNAPVGSYTDRVQLTILY